MVTSRKYSLFRHEKILKTVYICNVSWLSLVYQIFSQVTGIAVAHAELKPDQDKQ